MQADISSAMNTPGSIVANLLGDGDTHGDIFDRMGMRGVDTVEMTSPLTSAASSRT